MDCRKAARRMRSPHAAPRASVAIKACSVTKGDLFSHLLRKCQLPHRGSLLDSPPSTWAPPPPSFDPGVVYSSAGVDNSPRPTYNKDEERTTHAVAPQRWKTLDVTLTNHESIRHLAEWRLLFLRSYTMIVTVYLPMWNVIRMVPTPFRRCRSNRLRVCVRPSALAGDSILS